MKVLQALLMLEMSVSENRLKLSVEREAPAWQIFSIWSKFYFCIQLLLPTLPFLGLEK